MTQAEQYRMKHGQLTTINGFTSEYVTHWPNVQKHPESNALAQGWVFDDKSELWETDNNGIRSLYTVRP